MKESTDKVILDKRKPNRMFVEGVLYNEYEDSFTFDLINDSQKYIIKLTNHGLIRSELYDGYFFFKYQFEPDVSSQIRTKFIESIKFHEGMKDNDIATFIKRAVNTLDSTINLRDYRTVVYPQPMSEIIRKMLSYLRMFGFPDFISFELVKLPPSEMVFDYVSYKHEVLDATYQIGDRVFPKYTEEQKCDILSEIEKMMEELKNKDFFSIESNIRTMYCDYLHNIYCFNNDNEKREFEKLCKPKVLVIDDVMTSGASLNIVIDTLYKVNPSVTVVVFSLIGKD